VDLNPSSGGEEMQVGGIVLVSSTKQSESLKVKQYCGYDSTDTHTSV